MALALPKSICPAKRSLSAAMVRPMSLSVAASSSLISAEIASPASIFDNCLRHVRGDDLDLLALLRGEVGAAGLLVDVEQFLALLDHLAHDVEDFGVGERHALGGAGFALQNLGIDQPQRRDAALVAGLHGVLERIVDLVAQHGYGLSQIRPRAVGGRAEDLGACRC